MVGTKAGAGDEVLHARQRAAGVQGFHLGGGHFGDVFRILAVPGAQLHAVGLEDHVIAYRAGLGGIAFPQLFGQLRVAGGAEGVVRGIDVATPGVEFTVGGEGEGYAQPGSFGHGLHFVVRAHLFVRCAVGVVQVIGDAVHVDVIPHGIVGTVIGTILLIQGIRVGEIHAGIVAAGADVVQQHGLFLECHLAQQVGDAVLDIRPPVLVHVQLSIIVQILELQSVHGDDVLDCRLNLRLLHGQRRDAQGSHRQQQSQQ